MVEGVRKVPEILGDIRAADLFPDVITGAEVDRRIKSSEGRIKLWVITGVTANLMLALPTIFFMGRMAQSVDQMADSVSAIQVDQKANESWMRDRLIFEAQVESTLREKGMNIK